MAHGFLNIEQRADALNPLIAFTRVGKVAAPAQCTTEDLYSTIACEEACGCRSRKDKSLRAVLKRYGDIDKAVARRYAKGTPKDSNESNRMPQVAGKQVVKATCHVKVRTKILLMCLEARMI